MLIMIEIQLFAESKISPSRTVSPREITLTGFKSNFIYNFHL